MIPSPGHIVAYTLSAHDVEQINRRRHDASHTIDAIRNGERPGTGEQLHVGNPVQEGDVYPLVITRVWGQTEGSAVNGQVLLDGNDTFWATSRTEGEGPFHWQPFPRV